MPLNHLEPARPAGGSTRTGKKSSRTHLFRNPGYNYCPLDPKNRLFGMNDRIQRAPAAAAAACCQTRSIDQHPPLQPLPQDSMTRIELNIITCDNSDSSSAADRLLAAVRHVTNNSSRMIRSRSIVLLGLDCNQQTNVRHRGIINHRHHQIDHPGSIISERCAHNFLVASR